MINLLNSSMTLLHSLCHCWSTKWSIYMKPFLKSSANSILARAFSFQWKTYFFLLKREPRSSLVSTSYLSHLELHFKLHFNVFVHIHAFEMIRRRKKTYFGNKKSLSYKIMKNDQMHLWVGVWIVCVFFFSMQESLHIIALGPRVKLTTTKKHTRVRF